MRIIAGKYRRRTILANPGIVTRPITDRVKETLFERMDGKFINKKVADIFSGTGTIGLEALSRGASRVTFIENDRKAVEILKKNIEHIGCEEECLVWPADVRRCSFRPKGNRVEEFSPFDAVFYDPPYKNVTDIQPESPLWLSLRRLSRDDTTSPGALLIFRTPERAEFTLPVQWQIDRVIEMSNMQIHIGHKVASFPTAADREQESSTPDDSDLAPGESPGAWDEPQNRDI